jgi:glycosyltransferase involved in cell wall biosynthesis
MQLSIITINYNNSAGLERTIRSVLAQSESDFEFVVVDGESSDGSLDVIRDHERAITKWISEPDEGIYHAMNKGIALASGDYLYFLNSGDELAGPDVLEEVITSLRKDPVDILYGDVFLVDDTGGKTLRSFPDELRFSFFLEQTITHQAVFFSKALFAHQTYSEHLQLVADWEFLICAICKRDASYRHLPVVVCHYDHSGVSSQGSSEIRLASERQSVLSEHFQVFLEDGQELISRRRRFGSKRFRAFFKLERNKLIRTINYGVMRLLGLFVSSGKN